MVDALRRLEAVIDAPEVADEELVGMVVRVLGVHQIDPADPVALILQVLHQMVADETSGAGNESSNLIGHCVTSSPSNRGGPVLLES
jgi:hypothetical protein